MSIDSVVVNMAVSDLFTPSNIMPIKVFEIISGSDAFIVHSPLMFGNILCKLCYFLPDVSVLVSVESLLLISFDRFMAVLFPLKFRCFTPKVRLICFGYAWTIAIAVHAPYFYTLRVFPDGNEYYCEYDCGGQHLTTTKPQRDTSRQRFLPSSLYPFVSSSLSMEP